VQVGRAPDSRIFPSLRIFFLLRDTRDRAPGELTYGTEDEFHAGDELGGAEFGGMCDERSQTGERVPKTQQVEIIWLRPRIGPASGLDKVGNEARRETGRRAEGEGRRAEEMIEAEDGVPWGGGGDSRELSKRNENRKVSKSYFLLGI
jgi:hypothetical protein